MSKPTETKAKVEAKKPESHVKDGKVLCHGCDKMLPLDQFPKDNRAPLRGNRWRFCGAKGNNCEGKRKIALRKKGEKTAKTATTQKNGGKKET